MKATSASGFVCTGVFLFGLPLMPSAVEALSTSHAGLVSAQFARTTADSAVRRKSLIVRHCRICLCRANHKCLGSATLLEGVVIAVVIAAGLMRNCALCLITL